MRVLLDASYADRGPSGTAVYIERLAEALRRRDGIELIEARQPRRPRRGGRNTSRSAVNAALDAAWLHRGLPRAAREARADVVHHPLPAYSSRTAVRQVATVHDPVPSTGRTTTAASGAGLPGARTPGRSSTAERSYASRRRWPGR